MRTIFSADAPAPIGPYSQAIQTSHFVFCSGQVPIVPSKGALIEGDISAQAEQALKNLGAVLLAAGAGYGDVVKTTIFLVDMADFASVNTVYARYFGDNKPARTTVAVAGLPLGARVEIDAIALVQQTRT
ncbi:MAG: RidA family protein [Candidatus Eremiobacteraeota bacterium]|nr:RidA family protein [Candidatus Eremiobacteraeota bacterium]